MNKCNITIKGKEDVTLAGNTGGSLMNIVNNSKEIIILSRVAVTEDVENVQSVF